MNAELNWSNGLFWHFNYGHGIGLSTKQYCVNAVFFRGIVLHVDAVIHTFDDKKQCHCTVNSIKTKIQEISGDAHQSHAIPLHHFTIYHNV